MLPDRVSNPGPLTYESGALPFNVCNLDKNSVMLVMLTFEMTLIFLYE